MKTLALMAISTAAVLAVSTLSAQAQRGQRSSAAETGDGIEASADGQQEMSWATFRHRQFSEGVVGNNWDNGYALSPAYWHARGITAGIEGLSVDEDGNHIYDPNIAGAYTDVRRTQKRGRSAVSSNAASGGFGQYCTTPVKSCQLNSPSALGGGCSCKVAGGRSRGQVTP